MKELTVPKNVEMFSKSWAMTYTLENPNWYHTDQDYDDWNSYDGYDLNLYVCDGQLSVTVYQLADDGTGFMTTDTDTYKTVVQQQGERK